MTVLLKAGCLTAAAAGYTNRTLTTRRYITAEQEDRKQARVLTVHEVQRAFEAAKTTRFAAQDTVMLGMSVWAGLRACEITRVDACDQFDVGGKLSGLLILAPKVAKYRKQRSIPLRPCFEAMLQEFLFVNSRTEVRFYGISTASR